MNRWRPNLRALAAACLVLVALPLQAQIAKRKAGAAGCSSCHANAAQQFSASLHHKIIERATPLSVHGDFGARSLELRGSTYLLERSAAGYFITESYLRGKAWKHRIEYRLGGRRFEQYVTTLPDGSMMVLQPTWDITRKAWVHALDIHNPEASQRDEVSLWNGSCFSCHVDGGQKNFDLQTMQYRTQWRELGVACEQCHGEGGDHAKAATSRAAPAKVRAAIVNPARLDALRSTMVCAQCHSFRDIYVEGFRPGENYYDYFVPLMEYRLPNSGDAAYWADGRPRWLSNESVALWQSQCFLKGGATCVTCHSDSHRIDIAANSRLKAGSNTLCTRCHTAIAAKITEHTHHAANSAGNVCVECHMPRVVTGLNAEMRDHSISVPVPENTIRHDIPNACGLCHRDKDAQWVVRQVQDWYGRNSSRRKKAVDRADAFTAARRGDAAAIPGLQQILADASSGAWIRANAVGYLGRFSNDPLAYEAVLRALSDAEPLVRAAAALEVHPLAAQRSVAAPALAALLSDPVGSVRMNAALGLAAMGAARQLPAQFRAPFDSAKELYRRRAMLNSDDAGQQFAAGKFFLLAGDWDAAVTFLRATLQLNPRLPARYDLATALAEKGDTGAARTMLKSIPANDPQYSSAQNLLATLEANAGGGSATSSADADALFRQGQLAYQSANYGAALKSLDEALHAEPQAAWAAQAQVYRAICLAKLSRTAEAEAAMQALPANQEMARDLDLQLAWIELLYDTGRTEAALKRVDALIAAIPDAPMAHLWRARILMQLKRNDEAAAAAERSVQLSPNLVAAHNLLLRIYQLQGRTEEAAQQAEWLREYQRSTQSH